MVRPKVAGSLAVLREAQRGASSICLSANPATYSLLRITLRVGMERSARPSE